MFSGKAVENLEMFQYFSTFYTLNKSVNGEKNYLQLN